MIEEINRIKKEKDAIILSHFYVDNEIHKVSDFVGDSLELAKLSKNINAKTIVMAGVHFMAEMVKIFNPDKKVLLPTLEAQCDMAKMVNPEDIINLKKQKPNVPIVAYINTSAAVKAECDICCTSRNALSIVDSIKANDVAFVPDKNIANYVSLKSEKNIEIPAGFCYVHKEISKSTIIDKIRKYPNSTILAHPECNPEVLEYSHFIGSTGAMIDFIKNNNKTEYIIATESDFVEYLRNKFPDKIFYSTANLCIGMKKITLRSIKEALNNDRYKIEIDSITQKKALIALSKMIDENK